VATKPNDEGTKEKKQWGILPEKKIAQEGGKKRGESREHETSD